MPPARNKKARPVSAEHNETEATVAHHMVTLQSPVTTPTQSPTKKPVMISQSQKQALIDNLQLEVTERARKLRAQYALQAQSLHTRIEMRVNRIPTSLRKANIGELYEKLKEIKQQTQKPESEGEVSGKDQVQLLHTETLLPSDKVVQDPTITSTMRGTKRPSDSQFDKENTPDPHSIPNPKKRPRPNPATILSPKSSNSNNLAHHSPVRPNLASMQKPSSNFSCPTSPLKADVMTKLAMSAPPAKAAAIAATWANSAIDPPKTGTVRTRGAAATKKTTVAKSKARGPAAARAKKGVNKPAPAPAPAMANETRTVSAASNTSTGTTVVKTVGKAAGGGKTRGKKENETKAPRRAPGKKAVAASEASAPAPGRRVLRKRN
ncbi:MAG: hypothetical protein Q9214_000118 [Letrouitia sp. 1 TL-2023]